MSWPWSELGLPGPAALPDIRQAYAKRLKTAHPEENPEKFQRLHAAYQEASRYARRAARSAPEEPKAPRQAPSDEKALQQKDCGEPKTSPEGAEAREPEWDYEKLLKDQEHPQAPPKKTDAKEPEWDYDELLKAQQRTQKPPQKTESKDSGQNCEKLLEEDEEPVNESKEQAEETAEWDYERLFAEGEAEAQAARRRRLEELRKKNRARYEQQEKEQRRRAADEEESWASVMAAAHALELLYATGAPLSQWRQFLENPVFLNVRANIDFVFALEDFLEQHPDISKEVRRAFFLAYESCNASRYPMYNRLYRLLNIGRKDKRRIAQEKSGWRARWRSFPLWRKACAVGCLVVLSVCMLIIWFGSVYNDYEPPVEEPDIPWAEQAPQWLEEDYGESFVPGPSENLFAPASDPELCFWAYRDSKRSAGWPGYRTNYPYVRVRQALEAFAEEQELTLVFLDNDEKQGGAPQGYLLNLPLLGAEENVAALGEELVRLAAQPWHQRSAAKRRSQQGIGEVGYHVYLCHKDLAFYDGYAPKSFDAEEALSFYAQVGPAFCRYILENSGLADQHLGEEAYVLQDQESVKMEDGTFFHVTGIDKNSGEAKAQYFLDSGGGMLFCVPNEKIGQIHSIIDLYQGTPRNIQLDKVGLVIVIDQIQPADS